MPDLLIFLTFVGIVHGFLVSLDALLAPHQKAVVINYFEDHWYRDLYLVRLPKFRVMAGRVGEALYNLSKRENIFQFMKVAAVITALFYLASQVIQFANFYFESREVVNTEIPLLFLSFWIWNFPIVLISNILLFYVSVLVTSRICLHISKGDRFDAFFLPWFDLTFALFLFFLSAVVVRLIPVLYGLDFTGLAFTKQTSWYFEIHMYINHLFHLKNSLGGGIYGAAYSLLVPTLLLYAIYFLVLLFSIIELIASRVFAHTALLNSYSKSGERPFTTLAYFVSAFLLVLKLVQIIF